MKKLTGQRLELLVFTLITLFNLYPFLALHFFPTLDGASHMSNAKIISQIIVCHNELIRQFFMINPEPVPNWTAHLILSVTGLILPAFLAEKILLLILLAGTPFAFRSLLRTIAPNNIFYAYLIFPFLQSMFFYFGFYNFCIAIIFLLITLTFWVRRVGVMEKPWNLLRLAGLITLTYFSHILAFGALLVIIACYILSSAFYDLAYNKKGLRKSVDGLIRQSIQVVIASALPLLLFFYFFLSRPGSGGIIHLPFQTLLNNLLNMQPLIVFDGIREGKLTYLLFRLIVVFALIALIFRTYKFVRNIIKPKEISESNHTPGFYSGWIFLSIVFLMGLYFTLPDAMGSASYTTYRLGFIAFLLLILWIAASRLYIYTGLVAAVLAIYLNFSLLSMKESKVLELEQIAISCNKASDFVAPNSVLLPIYCMDNWFIGHFVDYIAIDKPMVMLYNYECETGFFPVRTNQEDKPNYYLGNPGVHRRLIKFEHTKGKPFRKINYVFLVGGCNPVNTDNWEKIDHILSTEFVVAYKTVYCTLYQKKN